MKTIKLLVTIVGLMLLLSGCSNSIIAESEIPTKYVSGSSVVDLYNKSAMTGLVDHIFIGKIVEKIGTKYINPKQTATKIITDPMTVYTVIVEKNIKGLLKKNILIEVIKEGGISEDGSEFVLYEGDALPVEGNMYVFYSSVDANGNLGLSGPTSCILINNYSDKSFQESTLFADVNNSLKNEIKFERKRYKSRYEE